MLLNRNTCEYIACASLEEEKERCRLVLQKLKKNEAICPQDVGTSRWTRHDHIVVVPEHLVAYVKKEPKYVAI